MVKIIKKEHLTNVEIINKISIEKMNQYNGNCFFSTYGLFCLFEILSNGTTGETNSALKKLLCDDDISVHCIAESDHKFKNTSLVFHNSNLDLSDEFIKSLEKNNVFYDSIDLNNLQKRITELNRKLTRLTNNNIENPLNKNDFGKDFVMLLINVLYFCADWQKIFNKDSTKQMVFKNRENTKVDMMRIWDCIYDYYENEILQSIQLPYVNCPYKMIICLPKSNENINNIDLEEIVNNMAKHTVTKLMLPKFKIEQEENLIDECCNLGLGKMFSPSDDFNHMFDNSTNKKCITQIKQKVYINVDENGTTAAVMTEAFISKGKSKPSKKIKEVEFIADHPFSFFIMGPNNIVIFAGKFYGHK